MKKTLIIFDIDGTLLYSNKVDSICFAETYTAQFEKPFPTIDWRQFPHVTDHTIFNTVIKNDFGRAATDTDIQKQRSHFVEMLQKKRIETPEAFKEIPGAIRLVNKLLKDEKYLVGIATGGWKAPAQIKLNHLGFPIEQFYASYADNKITREDILSESIELARMAHSDIGRIVYVGDAVWDVKTTRNMGLNFIGVRLKGDFQILKAEGADQVIHDFMDTDHFFNLVEIAQPPRNIVIQ